MKKIGFIGTHAVSGWHALSATVADVLRAPTSSTDDTRDEP